MDIRILRSLVVSTVLFVSACSFLAPNADLDADVIVIGDSVLAWHRGSARSIPDVVADETGLRVSNVAVSGAKFITILNSIAEQYAAGDWDWVIVNGGGNDLLPVCGTANEAQVLASLITADGTQGAIPNLVNAMARGDTKVIVLGYYPVSDQGGPFARCRNVLNELAVRQARMAQRSPMVIFVDSTRVIGSGDISAYAPDMVHPSPRGAALIGQLIALEMMRNGG